MFQAGVIFGIEKVAGACAEGSDRKRVSGVAELRKKMEAGDIVNTNPRSLDAIGKIYKPLSNMVQGTRFGHSAIYDGRGNVIEGRMGKGVIKRSLKDLAECNEIRVVRPKADKKQRSNAASYAKKQIGRDFSMVALATGGLKPTVLSGGHEGSAQRRALDSLFCSSLIANAYHKVPFNPKRSISDTRPVDIMKSRRVKRVGGMK